MRSETDKRVTNKGTEDTERRMRLLANYLIDRFLEETENGLLQQEKGDTIVEEQDEN